MTCNAECCLITLLQLQTINLQVEYEECIEAMERGQREAVYLSGKLAAALLEPETIR